MEGVAGRFVVVLIGKLKEPAAVVGGLVVIESVIASPVCSTVVSVGTGAIVFLAEEFADIGWVRRVFAFLIVVVAQLAVIGIPAATHLFDVAQTPTGGFRRIWPTPRRFVSALPKKCRQLNFVSVAFLLDRKSGKNVVA